MKTSHHISTHRNFYTNPQMLCGKAGVNEHGGFNPYNHVSHKYWYLHPNVVRDFALIVEESGEWCKECLWRYELSQLAECL